MSTCDRLDLQTLGSQPVIMPQDLPNHCRSLFIWHKSAGLAKLFASGGMDPMIGENRQLVTDEPVEAEK